MSNFLAAVMVGPEHCNSLHDIYEECTSLLAPFDGTMRVPEYGTSCRCVGVAAHKEAEAQADLATGGRKILREKFNKELKEKHPDIWPWGAEGLRLWEVRTREYNRIRDEAFEHNPRKDLPRSDCDVCHGSGIRVTSYNPVSKWDSWAIGGKWNLVFSVHHQVDKGTIDSSEVPRILYTDAADVMRLPLVRTEIEESLISVNALPAQLYRKLLADDPQQVPAFAVIGGDGAWHQKGQMGLWDIATDVKEAEVWEHEMAQVMSEYPDHLVVACDCHI